MTDKLNQDGSINENWLAEEITKRESGLEEVNIGQTKEILKVTLEILAELKDEFDEDKDASSFDKLIPILALIDKHAKSG